MNYGGLAKIFAFSDFERHRWVAEESKKIQKGACVLDVGAGNCRYRSLFDHCIYKTHDFAKMSDESITEGYGQLDYVSDICNIPVKDESFDVVLCTEVLEHVPEPIAAIKELSRILKHNGILLLTAPQRCGVHLAPYHFYGGYSPFWYHHFLPRHGLKVISMDANGGFFKAYGESTQRFVSILFPHGGPSGFRRKIFFPIFVLLKTQSLFVCLVCFWLDRLDKTKEFTVGYHIKAVKEASQ